MIYSFKRKTAAKKFPNKKMRLIELIVLIFPVLNNIIIVKTKSDGDKLIENALMKDYLKNTRNIDGDFKVLLDVYKLSPLRKSKIYENFSRNILRNNLMSTEYSNNNYDKNKNDIDMKFNTMFNSIHDRNETKDFDENFNNRFKNEEEKDETKSDALTIFNKSDNMLNYLGESIIDSADGNDSSIVTGKYDEKNQVPIVQIPVDISIPDGNKIEVTRTTNSIGAKVESNSLYDENDYIIVLK